MTNFVPLFVNFFWGVDFFGNITVRPMERKVTQHPDLEFHKLGLPIPSCDVPELHRIRQSSDHEAKKMYLDW